VVPVTLEGRPLPFVESFELGEGQDDLGDLGWGGASLAFIGYGWYDATTLAYDGAYAAYHARGYGDDNEMEDWLVSPPIDLSTVASAQVSWYELGSRPEDASHALYATTGDRSLPGDDWQLVAELTAPPEGEWGRAVVDLSAFAGNQAVSLAWVYTGAEADEWYVDLVEIGELAPWLEATWAVAEPVSPGGDGTLVVSVENVSGTEAAAATVSVRFPDGGATVTEASQTISDLPVGSVTTADFALHVDEATPDNSYLPVAIDVASGDDLWTFAGTVLVGEASLARVVFTPSESAPVELVLGVGDPDAPAWETSVWSGVADGLIDVTLDVTDQREHLPPSAGDGRWFLRASPQVAGEVDLFTITWDGQEYECEDLPVLAAGETGYAYLPEPPAFSATVTSSPSTLAPGEPATLTVTFENAGSASSGAVLATLASADPDVTVTDAGPVDLGDVGADETVTASGAFSIEVASSHTDSTDLALELTLTDDVESWTVPVALAVPYPVLRVTRVEVEGDDDADGVLDPGETAEVSFEVTNVGDESCDGSVTGTLSVEATSTAGVDVVASSERFGGIVAGGSEYPDDPWSVAVTSGAEGDTVDFLLTLTDSSRSYEVRTTLALGEPAWQSLDPLDDEVGDAVGGWDFDIVRGRYRVNAGTLQIELDSQDAFDPDTLFVEVWGYAAAADWYYYRMLLQSGVAKMQGYGSSGFVDISTLTVSYPDADTVRFETTVADLGLATNSLALGFASGWCGPDEYFCDHYPDGWGYPYSGDWSSAEWFDLNW
jgi:hypothetical protein